MWWINQVQTPTVTIPSLTIPTVIVAVFVAIVIGLVVQALVGYTHIGFVGHVLVGIIGALLGSLLAVWLKLPTIFLVAGVDVVWTLLGSFILVIVLAFFVGGSRYQGYVRRRFYR